MHGTEGINATGTELLNQFGRVQVPDRKEVGKGRKLGGTSLRLEAPNESGVEWRTKWEPQLVLR